MCSNYATSFVVFSLMVQKNAMCLPIFLSSVNNYAQIMSVSVLSYFPGVVMAEYRIQSFIQPKKQSEERVFDGFLQKLSACHTPPFPELRQCVGLFVTL